MKSPNWPGVKNPRGLSCMSCYDWEQQLWQCQKCKEVWCDHCGGKTMEENGEVTEGEYIQRGCLEHWKELDGEK